MTKSQNDSDDSTSLVPVVSNLLLQDGRLPPGALVYVIRNDVPSSVSQPTVSGESSLDTLLTQFRDRTTAKKGKRIPQILELQEEIRADHKILANDVKSVWDFYQGIADGEAGFGLVGHPENKKSDRCDYIYDPQRPYASKVRSNSVMHVSYQITLRYTQGSKNEDLTFNLTIGRESPGKWGDYFNRAIPLLEGYPEELTYDEKRLKTCDPSYLDHILGELTKRRSIFDNTPIVINASSVKKVSKSEDNVGLCFWNYKELTQHGVTLQQICQKMFFETAGKFLGREVGAYSSPQHIAQTSGSSYQTVIVVVDGALPQPGNPGYSLPAELAGLLKVLPVPGSSNDP